MAREDIEASSGDGPTLYSPSSVAEVADLVKRLYSGQSPAEISRIEASLQKIQRSQDGWQLADALLGYEDSQVQFFGALTFTVKLNSDWQSLDDENAGLVLQKIVSWLVHFALQSNSTMVTKKLTMTLVTYFLRFSQHWKDCVKHVIASLERGQWIPSEVVVHLPETRHLLSSLDGKQLLGALWFSAALAETLGRTNTNNLKNQKLHERASLNIDAVVALNERAFSLATGEEAQRAGNADLIAVEGIENLQSWIFYAQRAFSDSPAITNPLKICMKYTVQLLQYEDLSEMTLELLIEVLSNYPAFLREEDLQLLHSALTSEWGYDKLQSLKNGDYDELLTKFARLLLSFADNALPQLLESAQDNQSQKTFYMLHALLTCEGYAVAEDYICPEALEFWISFVEFAVDSMFGIEPTKIPWISDAKQHIAQAIEELWLKLRFPPQEEFDSWESDNKRAFSDFRKDAADMLQSSYRLIGASMFERTINAALFALEQRSWPDVEVAIFSLNALSENVVEGDYDDNIIARLYGSSLFSSLSEMDASIPKKTRQSVIVLIGEFSHFLERRTEFLPAALQFLFKQLETPVFASTASRSISTLCERCRGSLTSEIDSFLLHYDTFVSNYDPETSVKERVLGAIAAIVQALPQDDLKIEPISRLLGFVQTDTALCQTKLRQGQLEEGKNSGLAALQCLANIAKKLQDPVIDLVSPKEPTKFWNSGLGAEIQATVIRIVENVVAVLGDEGDIIEAACSVLRAGLMETTPGPFVLPSSIITNFVLRSTAGTPRLGQIITTASVLISSHSADSSSRIDEDASRLLSHVYNLIQSLGDHDPEVSQTCIDFMAKLLRRYTNVLLDSNSEAAVGNLLTFTLKCLDGRDWLPKRSAASFWSSFVLRVDPQDPFHPTFTAIMSSLGPDLAHVLITNIGGKAARSELDIIAEPLKKMAFKQARSKAWLEAALFSEGFPSTKVNSAEKRAFLQRVLTFRGSKSTNQVVKDFWLSCMGSDFAYTS
ncbi:MAG: 60S ribosomal protein L2A [Chaenotheca gracillima]|nr:MAG: 60S ribosomal protein L2A [Chaenotheca gracillima]